MHLSFFGWHQPQNQRKNEKAGVEQLRIILPSHDSILERVAIGVAGHGAQSGQVRLCPINSGGYSMTQRASV